MKKVMNTTLMTETEAQMKKILSTAPSTILLLFKPPSFNARKPKGFPLSFLISS